MPKFVFDTPPQTPPHSAPLAPPCRFSVPWALGSFRALGAHHSCFRPSLVPLRCFRAGYSPACLIMWQLLAVSNRLGCDWSGRLCWCQECPVIRSFRTRATNRRSSASSLNDSAVENISSRRRLHPWPRSAVTSSSARQLPSTTAPRVSDSMYKPVVFLGWCC